MTNEHIYKIIKIYGMVQGIGYRPFVNKLANTYGISGCVRNQGGIVTVYAASENAEAMKEFIHSLKFVVPKGGKVDRLEVKDAGDNISKDYFKKGFRIIKSDDQREEIPPLLPIDIATCKDCARELFTKDNKRYRYPFISCTKCGPRYSIIKSIPYDRENTTMNVFKMCKSCLEEYENVDNPRCYAQTNSCEECGPVLMGREGGLILKYPDTQALIKKAENYLLMEKVIAIKDIGGYHLCCMADSKRAVDTLRKIKSRDEKAFAVMFNDVEGVRKYCHLSEKEVECLESDARPIVLLKKLKEVDFIGNVSEDSYAQGVLLPGNPLQMIIMRDMNIPLVMTSANVSGEPIITREEDIFAWQDREADISFVLFNNREIVAMQDDSLLQVVADRVQILRRARGYVPLPVEIQGMSKDIDILAAGGDLKNSFCVYSKGRAYMSQYLGDMENVNNEKLFTGQIKHMKHLLNTHPNRYVVDKHPLYNSKRILEEQAINKDITVSCIQHHIAHGASVIAENSFDKRLVNEGVLGIIWDGTGYGDDGNVWGGEFIYYPPDMRTNEPMRIGHIKSVRLIGGDESSKNAKATRLSYLYNMSEKIKNEYLDTLSYKEQTDYETIKKALDMEINSVLSTSMGRLFDAAAAFLNVSERNNYEGQCAIRLETKALQNTQDVSVKGEYIFKDQDMIIGDTIKILKKLLVEKLEGKDVSYIAMKFHKRLVKMAVDMVVTASDLYNTKNVILSGGSFQNTILLENTIKELEEKDYNVYINQKVPSGDGGIALGQVYMELIRNEV